MDVLMQKQNKKSVTGANRKCKQRAQKGGQGVGGRTFMVWGVAVRKGLWGGWVGGGHGEALYDLWYTHNPRRDRRRAWL